MQNTNVYKIQSYAVFSGFTNSIIISLCLIKSSNQMCDGRLEHYLNTVFSQNKSATNADKVVIALYQIESVKS
jgi:hypothetical protein